MRKILSLLMMMFASIALVFADEPVQIASGTFNGKNATYTEGWTTTGTGVSRTDCIIIGADESITSPEVDLSQYESISVAIKARRYGTLSGSKAEIAVTFDGEAIGNTVASGTSATTALDVINYEVSDLSTGNFVVTCTNATSAGSTHGAGINSIVITGVLKSQQGGGDDPQPATRTIYLNGGGSSLWNQADAVFFVHAWGGTGVDVKMTLVEGDVYSVAIPSDNTSILFVRMAPGSEAIDWDNKWNQSADQTIPADKDLFTMTDWSNGVWSVYGDTPEPPAPVEAAYYLVGTMNSWQAVEDYKFAPAEAEGEYLLHTTLAVDDEIKVIKVEGETTTWYPAEGGNYVVDAAHAGEKDIYFRPAGNEAWAEFGGYIWMGENQPAPVADFTQPFTLKFNGTGESGTDNSAAFAADVAAIFDAASAPYVASVETATKIYAGRPIADDNSSVKFGTTSAQGSLSFTLAQAIEVDSIIVNATQYGNDAAEVTINGIKFDLTQGNKVPTDCKLVPNGAISEITIAQTGSQRIYLRNIRVYPKNQGGDTPVEIVLPVVKLAGTLTSWSEPALMVNAEDSLSASVTLNLGIDHYQLKVVSDDNWLSKAGDGDLYTMHRDWNHVDHLDLINTGDNIKLITDVEGAYTFTWTYADSTLVVTFPEAPAQPKFYITGNEDIVGEGNPTWGKNGALESFSDTLVMNLAAGFHKFKLITPAEQWLGMEALTDTAYGLFTDEDTNICFNIAEAGEVTVIYNATEFKVEGNFYVAPKVAYYLIGDSAFVVDAGATADKAWTPDAIPCLTDTTVLNLKAGVDYIMRLSLEGTWENHRDFRHLTDTAAGLIELPDEFGNHSIGFSLAEAGEVTIIYIPAANEQPEVFKLIGNFYVAPAPDPTVAVMGSMNNWAEEIPFVLSDDKSYASLTVENISAGNYEFKFIINGEWRSNGYTYHRGFPGAANITENNKANMIFQADQDGEYTFYWYFANDSAAIVYPEYIEPAKEYYAKYAPAWEWVKLTEAEGLWLTDTIVYGGIGININDAAADENNMFYSNTVEEEGVRPIAGAVIDVNDTIYFTFNPADSVVTAVMVGAYVAPDPTVAVMGSMNNWAEEIPFVLSDDKSYASLTVENIGADNYEFKFVINGEWRSNGYTYHRGFPGAAGITENNDANMIFQADVEGQYTFYWYFANDSAAIVYPELPFLCNWEELPFLGDGSPEQTYGNQFKLCKEGEYPGVVNVQKPGFAKESGIYVTFPSAAFGEISLPEGSYAIQGAGMILYCSAFDTQLETEVTVICDGNPIVFTVYNANYTPAPPTGNIRLVPGVWNLDNAKFAAVTWHVGEDFENGTVSAWFEYLNADTLIGNVPNDADSIAFARFNSAAEVPSMDMSMIWNHTDKLLIDKQTMIYTISGWPEEGRDFCPGYWGEYVEPVYVLENGYYLVGNFSGVDAWSVEDLSAEKKFAANPETEGEYQLAVNMAENDQVKVAYVENDQIIYWYPKGDNYTVDHNHAGPTTMYFRPDYFDDWNAFGGYFYIVPTSTVDITNIDANAPAVKILRDGQILIIKGNKTFNAQGQLVK